MAINVEAITRVIIQGEWIWVERGTFRVRPFEFQDQDGKMFPEDPEPGYYFQSTIGDPYFGPLREISLMKLESQLIGEDDGESGALRKAPGALMAGEADESAGQGDQTFSHDPFADPDTPSKPRVALFEGDDDGSGGTDVLDDPPEKAPEEPAGPPSRKGGLF